MRGAAAVCVYSLRVPLARALMERGLPWVTTVIKNGMRLFTLPLLAPDLLQDDAPMTQWEVLRCGSVVRVIQDVRDELRGAEV